MRTYKKEIKSAGYKTIKPKKWRWAADMSCLCCCSAPARGLQHKAKLNKQGPVLFGSVHQTCSVIWCRDMDYTTKRLLGKTEGDREGYGQNDDRSNKEGQGD